MPSYDKHRINFLASPIKMDAEMRAVTTESKAILFIDDS